MRIQASVAEIQERMGMNKLKPNEVTATCEPHIKNNPSMHLNTYGGELSLRSQTGMCF